MHLFINTEAECVDELPHDIDGFKLYKIKCSPQEWVQKSQDLQYFKMNTSRSKELIGTRKAGRCLGSLYCMSANCPFKHSAEGQSNMMNFENVSGHKVCFSCRSIASRKWYGACKMTDYCQESGTLTVYHVGVHKCHLRKDTKYIKSRSGMPCCKTEVWVLKVFSRPRWAKQLLMVICTMDKKDKCLIYQINNSQFNGQPNYVFKSSVPMAQMATDMDQDGPEHPLQGEEAYFNGCHSRCAGYKTLALFVYHTAMHHILRLAMMEVKSESTQEISIFWELFNEILSEIKGTKV